MKEFQCECGGETKVVSEDRILHACQNKYSPAENYYDGGKRFIPYKRVRINPAFANCEDKYNWFVDWS